MSDPADEIDQLSSEERTNYPLTLSVDDLGEGFLLTAQVSQPIAPERVCAFMTRALAELLQALQEAPQTPASRIDVLLDEAEREQVLHGGTTPHSRTRRTSACTSCSKRRSSARRRPPRWCTARRS